MSAETVRLHATVVGGGPRTAVYLPGIGHHGDDGRPIAEAIRDSHTTHLFDLPGTGRSAPVPGVRTVADVAPVLDAYLDSAGLEGVDLIGHSMGGILALGYALASPARVRSLTLLDSGFFRVPRFPTKICGPVGYVMPVVDIAYRVLGERAVRMLGSAPSNALAPGTPIDYEHDLAEIDPRALGVLLATYRADAPAMLHRVGVPCLLMYGGRQDAPRERGKVLRQVAPFRGADGISLVELSGGHDAHREDDGAEAAVAAFLASPA